MSQQINLLNPQLLPPRDWLGMPTLLSVLAVTVALLLGLYGWASYRSIGLAQEQRATAAELETLRTQLARSVQAHAPRQPSQALAEELARTEAMLQSRREVLAILENGGVGSAQGFSAYLQAFARQRVSGLWLTGFGIDAPARQISLQGKALQPELVARYITVLGQEPLLKGREFAALQMEHAASAQPGGPAPVSPGAIEFRLQSVDKSVDTPAAGGKS